jgi:hypothetical protein
LNILEILSFFFPIVSCGVRCKKVRGDGFESQKAQWPLQPQGKKSHRAL